MRTYLTGVLIAVFAYVGMGASCQNRNPVTLTGQSGLAVARSIDEVRKMTNALGEQKVLTPEQVVSVLERLKPINAALEPLPALLRTVDVNNPDLSTVDKAIAILDGAGQNLSIVIGGVPIAQATQPLVELIRAAQKTITTTLVELARLKGE